MQESWNRQADILHCKTVPAKRISRCSGLEIPSFGFIGGPGYESYVDGYNSDPYTDCGDWLKGHWELAARAALIEGQWRTEIEVTPSQADGNLIHAIYVSGSGAEERPKYSIRTVGPRSDRCRHS